MENRGPELVAVVIAFLISSWLMVGLRCWVRIRIVKAFLIDDWLTLVTLFIFTGYCVCAFVGVAWGVGQHNSALTLRQGLSALEVWWISELFYVLCTTFLRLAAGTFLLRFALRKWHRTVLFTCLTINVVFNVYYFISSFLQCSPLPFFWLHFDTQAKGMCYDTWGKVNTYVAIGLMALIDYVFGLLPFCILWELNINRRRKVLVGLILSLACLAGTATLIRLPYVYTLSHSTDFLYFTVDLAIWSYVEPGLGLVALSLITLGPLFRSILSAARSTPGHSSEGPSKPSPQSSPASSPTSNLKKQHWETSDAEYQLRGLPLHMGNTSIVEGALSRSNSDENKKKRNSKGWRAHFDNHRKGSDVMKMSLTKSQNDGRFTITRTVDYGQWSGWGETDEDIEKTAGAPDRIERA